MAYTGSPSYPSNAPAGSSQGSYQPGYNPFANQQTNFSYAAGLADAVRNAASFFGNIFSFGTLGGSSPSTSSSPTAAPTAATSPTSTTTPGATTPREAAAARTGPPAQPTYSVTGSAGKTGTTTAAPKATPAATPAVDTGSYAAGLGISEATAPTDISNFTDTRFGDAADFTPSPVAAVPGAGVEAAHQAIQATPEAVTPAAALAPASPSPSRPAASMTPVEKTAFAYDPGGNPAAKVDPALQAVTTRAQSYLPPNMTLGIVPYGGVRDPALQAELKAGGWSKTNNSYHLEGSPRGSAIDVLPRVDGQVVSGDSAAFGTVHDAMMRAANELGAPVTWGGDWKGFKDEPHYQINKADAAAFKQPQSYDPTMGRLVDTANLYPVPINQADWLSRAGYSAKPPTPPASIPNVPPGTTLPAGMRNNNPGNLKYTGSDFQRSHFSGMVGPSKNTDQGDPQIVFDTPASGMAAAAELARVKFDQGMNTVNKIITSKGGWTPGYGPAAINIAKTMGVGPNDPIDLHDPAQMQSFLRGLTLQEHGPAAMAYTDADIAAGVRGDRAGGGAPAAADAFASATPYPGLPPAAGTTETTGTGKPGAPVTTAAPAAAPAATDKQPSLRIGASGPAVRDLQTQLLAAGYNPGPIDGRFGQRTRDALYKFQQATPGTGTRFGYNDAVAGPKVQAALPAANPYRDIQPPEDIVVRPPEGYAAGLTPAAFDERFGPTPAPGITPAAFNERFGPTMAPAAAAPPPSAGPNFDETFNAPTPLPGQELTPEQGAGTMATRADLRDRLPGAAATAGAGYYRGLQSVEEDRASRARIPETVAATYAAITGGGDTNQFVGGPTGGLPAPAPALGREGQPVPTPPPRPATPPAAVAGATPYEPTAWKAGLVRSGMSPADADRYIAVTSKEWRDNQSPALGHEGQPVPNPPQRPAAPYTDPGLVSPDEAARARQDFERIRGGADTAALGGGAGEDQLREPGPGNLYPGEWPLSGAAKASSNTVPAEAQRLPELLLPPEGPKPPTLQQLMTKGFGRQADAGPAAAGAAALTAPEPDVVRTLASLPPEGQAQYRGAFVNNIIDSIDQAGDARGILKAIDASPQASRRLEVVLGPQGASQFKSLVRVDGIGNREPGTRFAAALPSMAGLRGSPSVDPQVATKVGQMLDSDDPAEFSRGLKIVAANPNLQALVQRVDAMV
jgi:hypothetical protein